MITEAGFRVLTEHGGGRVEQTIDIAGEIRRRTIDLAGAQFEEAMRAELVSLGWTPPDEAPPREAFMTIAKVCARTGLGRTMIYRMLRNGDFPAPMKFGARSLWVESEITDWLKAKAASAPRMGPSMGAR